MFSQISHIENCFCLIYEWLLKHVWLLTKNWIIWGHAMVEIVRGDWQGWGGVLWSWCCHTCYSWQMNVFFVCRWSWCVIIYYSLTHTTQGLAGKIATTNSCGLYTLNTIKSHSKFPWQFSFVFCHINLPEIFDKICVSFSTFLFWYEFTCHIDSRNLIKTKQFGTKLESYFRMSEPCRSSLFCCTFYY